MVHVCYKELVAANSLKWMSWGYHLILIGRTDDDDDDDYSNDDDDDILNSDLIVLLDGWALIITL